MPVYIVQAGEGGPVKVGFAENPHRRLSQLQAECPAPLALVALFDGSRKEESEVHAAWAQYRLRGEWFSPEALSMLAAVGLPKLTVDRKLGSPGRKMMRDSSTRAKAMQRRGICGEAQDAALDSIFSILTRCGGSVRVADACGISSASVSVWTQVPPRHVRAVAKLAGLCPSEVRPDLYDPPAARADAA